MAERHQRHEGRGLSSGTPAKSWYECASSRSYPGLGLGATEKWPVPYILFGTRGSNAGRTSLARGHVVHKEGSTHLRTSGRVYSEAVISGIHVGMEWRFFRIFLRRGDSAR